jgi:hypothetical protein
MSYEQGSYRVLLFLHNRITGNPYDQYSCQYLTATGPFAPVVAETLCKVPAADLND